MRSRAVLLSYPEPDIYKTTAFISHDAYDVTYLPFPHEQTDACENISFPQIRAVKISRESFFIIG